MDGLEYQKWAIEVDILTETLMGNGLYINKAVHTHVTRLVCAPVADQ